MTFFNILKQPRWYIVTLGILFALYLCGWGYSVQVAHLQQMSGYTPVMPVVDHDSTSYANLTQSILHGHFAEPGEKYEYFHSPGYPAFAAAIYFVTGSYFAVTLVQIALVFATALLTLVLGSTLANDKVGRVASILFLLNPLVPANAFFIVTDTPFAFLLTLGFTLIVTQFTRRPLATVLATGVIFGAACYVRPVGFIAFPVFVLPLLALAYPWRKKIWYAAVLLCVIALLLVPWMLRNKATSGVFSFTSLVAFNMSFYSIPHYWADTQHMPLDTAIAKVAQDSGVPEGLDANGYPANWYNLSSSPALSAFDLHAVLASPVHYVAWHLFYSTAFFVAPAFTPTHLTQNIKLLIMRGHVAEAIGALTHPWWFFAERLLVFLGLFLLCVGVWTLRRSVLALAFLLVILYMAALGGPSTAARYRVPLEPLLSTFMVVGAYALVSKQKHLY